MLNDRLSSTRMPSLSAVGSTAADGGVLSLFVLFPSFSLLLSARHESALDEGVMGQMPVMVVREHLHESSLSPFLRLRAEVLILLRGQEREKVRGGACRDKVL